MKTVAWRNGFCADFSPKPLEHQPGSGMHINISAGSTQELSHVIAGIMEKIREMTVFLNPCENSYERFGTDKAPAYISWSSENRSQLIRIPATHKPNPRAELRSADPTANPYLAFALLIYAGIYGVEQALTPPEPADINLFTAPDEVLAQFQKLPQSLKEAAEIASSSDFIRQHLPEAVMEAYCRR